MSVAVSCTSLQDTLFDHLVFETRQLLNYDVYEAGDEAGEEADQTADHPATDLQTAEALRTQEEERWDAKMKADFKKKL